MPWRAQARYSFWGPFRAIREAASDGNHATEADPDWTALIASGLVLLTAVSFLVDRSLAEAGHYPAIDIEASISRVMTAIVPKEQFTLVHQFKKMLSRYQRNHDLIAVGAFGQKRS